MAVFITFNIVGTRLDGSFHHLVGVTNRGLVGNFTDAVEGERNRAGFAQRATSLGEDGANVGGRAVAVVCQRFDDNRRAARTVTFVTHVIVVFSICTGRLLDGAVDVVLWHRLRFGVLNCQTQRRVHAHIRQTGLGSNGDFTREFGEHLRTDRILFSLAMHDVLEL